MIVETIEAITSCEKRARRLYSLLIVKSYGKHSRCNEVEENSLQNCEILLKLLCAIMIG